MKECPCGAGFPYTDCCGTLIRGASPADTAEDLMRSRFTAFARGEWDYLDKTRCSEEREPAAKRSSALQQEGIRWTRLEIVGVKDGGVLDEEGEVSFVAYYTEDGEEKTLCETSKFVKENGRWYYSEKQSKIESPAPASSSKPFVRDYPKIGRNDPCFCGSKKKFKKCCGK
ncbi:hypothetical protein UR09_02320 [Candidatus Nitromaritima sp. SCGC AAA799-A02]|nr:hypothetical protein UR09_02320 [Candidatus Nitromaritima sp. SCGC AAA799-A02]